MSVKPTAAFKANCLLPAIFSLSVKRPLPPIEAYCEEPSTCTADGVGIDRLLSKKRDVVCVEIDDLGHMENKVAAEVQATS